MQPHPTPINWCWNPNSYNWSWGLWRLWASVSLSVNKTRSCFPGLWGSISELPSIGCLDRPLPPVHVLFLSSMSFSLPIFLLSTHSSCLAYRNLLSWCHVSVCPFYFLWGCSKLILLPRNPLKPSQPTKIEQQCVCQNIFRCICCYPHYIILPCIPIESMEAIAVVSSLESTSHHSNGQPEPCVHLRDRLFLFKELISPNSLFCCYCCCLIA